MFAVRADAQDQRHLATDDSHEPQGGGGRQAGRADRTAAKENVGVAHYYLYRGNVKYRLLGNVTGFTDTGLTANTKYAYKVYALDAAGNWSAASTTVSATAR